MFKTFKILWLKIVREYHRRRVIHHYDKAHKCRIKDLSGIFYERMAWAHLYKELELNDKLHKLKGI